MIKIDQAFDIIGHCGRYQILLVSLLILVNIFQPTQLLLMVIVGAKPANNQTNGNNLNTIVEEFKLEDDEWIVDLMESLFMVGYMLGSFIFGQLSDIFGRRSVLLPNVALAGLTNIISGLTGCWQTFLVSRLFAGLFVGGCATAFTLVGELVGDKAWNWAGMIYHIAFGFGIGIFSGISFLLEDWRLICYVCGGIMFLLSVLLLFTMIESPRWLHSSGSLEKAEKQLEAIGRNNGRTIESIQLNKQFYLTTEANGMIQLVPPEAIKSSTLFDLLRHKTLAIWLFNGAFVWISSALIYYGLTLSVTDLTPNLFLGLALSGLVETPASIIVIFFMNSPKFGKRKTLILTFLICFCGLIGMVFKPDGSSAWRLSFGLTAKLAIASCFNVLFLYCAEIFPTSMRNVASGASSSVARIGSIVAPFISLAENKLLSLPYIIFSVCSFGSAVATFFLPTTDGYPLPQTVHEALNRKPGNQKLEREALINEE